MVRGIKADARRRFHVIESRAPGGKPFFTFLAKEDE
jgi:hypothetical protein